MKFNIFVGDIETIYPEFEIYDNEMIFIDIINLSDEDYKFLTSDKTRGTKKSLLFDNKIESVVFKLIDLKKQYIFPLKEHYIKFHTLYSTKKIAFGFTRYDGLEFDCIISFQYN